MGTGGLVFDLTLCYGCDACAAACRDEHLVPFNIALLSVIKTEADGEGERIFEHRLCMHCETPACLEACGEGALFFDEGKVVQVDDERCTGCGACIEACPHDALSVPAAAAVLPPSRLLTAAQSTQRDRWLRRAEGGVPAKCDLCLNRRRAGRPPACEAACPVGAVSFQSGEPEDGVRVRFIRRRAVGRSQ